MVSLGVGAADTAIEGQAALKKPRKRAKRRITRTAASLPAQPPNKSLSAQLPPSPRRPFGRHRLVRAVRRLFGVVVVAVGLLAGVYQVGGGPPWPADPEIHPQNALNGASLILPFIIHNRSTLIDMRAVELTCGVDWIVFGDASDNVIANFTDMAFSNGRHSIPVGQTINYSCDASALIRSTGDRLIFGPGALTPSGSALNANANILKMCVWIRGDYKIWGIVPWSFTSIIFQWPAATGAHQWLEGSLQDARAPSKSDALNGPPQALAFANCNPVPGSAYTLLKDGKLQLVEH